MHPAGPDGDLTTPDAVVIPPIFDATQIVPGGMITAVVASMTRDLTSPCSAICNMAYTLDADPGPEGTYLVIASGEIGPEGSPPTDIDITVDGRAGDPEWLVDGLIRTSSPFFLRGDIDGDGKLSVTDAVLVLRVVLQDTPRRFDCEDALDANDDGTVDLSDAIPILAWMFRGGARLPAPFLTCGEDETPDALECVEPNPNCLP
jgi:hypothetical protein